MPDVHHDFRTVAGRSVFFREAGPPDGPVVVLLHGAPSSSHMFRHLIPLLADDHHVIAPDLLGFGHSEQPPADGFTYSFDVLTDHVEALLDDLGVTRYAIYVQDYGAPVGWRLALRRPHAVRAVVTQNGNAYREGLVADFWDPLWAYTEHPGEATEKPVRDALSPAGIRWQYLHGVPDPTLVDPDAWTHDIDALARPGNLDVQLALLRDYHTNVALYPAVQAWFRASGVPLLAVWGRNDRIFDIAGARAFARDLPEAEIHALDGGHWLLESHLDAVAGHVRGFLGRVLPEFATHEKER